jgi:hypothetical protein
LNCKAVFSKHTSGSINKTLGSGLLGLLLFIFPLALLHVTPYRGFGDGFAHGLVYLRFDNECVFFAACYRWVGVHLRSHCALDWTGPFALLGLRGGVPCELRIRLADLLLCHDLDHSGMFAKVKRLLDRAPYIILRALLDSVEALNEVGEAAS